MNLESDCLALKLVPSFWARYLILPCLFICNVNINSNTHLTETLGELMEFTV